MNPIIQIPKHSDCFAAAAIAGVCIDDCDVTVILTNVAPDQHYNEYGYDSEEEAKAAHFDIVKQWKEAFV